MTIYQKYFSRDKKRIAVLLDPDKLTSETALRYGEIIEKSPAEIILAGGSLVNNPVEEIISALKQSTGKPVVLFPGAASQVVKEADALLYLSLISGRNPEYLIGEHVKTAFKIKKTGLEIIPTGYILIDGGKITSVQYISNTMPIPKDKPDLAAATAVAGEFLGLKCLYLEAGSGAENPIRKEMISAVRDCVSLPIITGGGLRSMQDIEKAFNAGADITVIGSAFEKNPDFFNSSILV
ncbi:MAG: geranylgeranylglyceryl/heptaprenylglyceryl phosphate synthase [Bacteroidales bacterium]|nr:geranylgeranylglyceryl/heptaprenylglyceryl phosphate synthase [Bacteroidales bacterium]